VQKLREAQKYTEDYVRQLQGDAVLSGVRNAALIVEGAAKKNLVAWQSKDVGGVDTGVLRASITPEVRQQGNKTLGVVGSNLVYAPFVELDTRPHWPPLAALELWAQRHGTTAYIVARAISRTGTKGKKYLQKALLDNEQEIRDAIAGGLPK
jgi:hypothetical protein